MTGEDKLKAIENDGWVEWPSFPENEKAFDWSLSYAEIERKYPNDPDAGFSHSNGYTSRKKRSAWFKKRQATLAEKRKEEVTKARYVNYSGNDCPCVGFLDKTFVIPGCPSPRKYQNAYYHSGEEKYVFEVDGCVVAYPKEKIGKFIKPFFPDAKDVGLSVNTNTSRSSKNGTGILSSGYLNEYEDYLRNQTTEQFSLAQKYGWRIAKLLTDPEPSFHEE